MYSMTLSLVDETTLCEWKESGKETFGKGNAVHPLNILEL